MRRTALLVVTLFAVGWANRQWACGDDGKAVTIEDVRKAWQARQDRVKSGKFIVEERQTDSKGSQTWCLHGKNGRAGAEKRKKLGITDPPEGTVLPAEDTTHTINKEITFDGGKFRFFYEGNHSFDGVRLVYERISWLTVSNSRSSKMSESGGASQPFPSGLVQRDARPIDANVPCSRPVLMTFRALDPMLRSYFVGGMKLTGGRSEVGGRPCVELHHQDSPMSYTRLWVDPGREFLIKRFVTTMNEKLLQDIEVQYREDARHGWIPSGWTIITFTTTGVLERTQVAEVRSYEINAPIDPGQFDIEFAPGTLVTDYSDDTFYLIRPGGVKRLISRKEMTRLNYEQIMSTEGEAGMPTVRWMWYAVGGGLALLVVSVVVSWQRRKRIVAV